MGFEEKLGISRKSFSVLMAVIVVGFVTLTTVAFTLNFAPYTYVGPLPNPGHGGDTVWVDVPSSGEMTLQDAITTGVIGGGGDGSLAFGNWNTTDSGQIGGTGAVLSEATTYQAATDGFVVLVGTNDTRLTAYTDGANPPATKRLYNFGYSNAQSGLTMPVRKDDYWRVTVADGTAVFFWIPIVDGSGGGGSSLPDCPTDGQILKYDLGSTSWTCVDEAGGTGGSLAFGDWVDLTGSFSWGTAYGPVASDGFITLWADGYHGGGGAQGYTDNSVNPTTLITGEGAGYVDYSHGLMMPVKKGNHWKISRTHAGYGSIGFKVRWIPIIDGGGGGSPLPACAAGQIVESDGAGGWVCSDGVLAGSTYVSPWQSITTGSNTTFNHPLGTDELTITLQFRPSAAGTVRGQHTSDFAGHGYGIEVYEITNTQIKVSGGSADIRFNNSVGLTQIFAAGGEVRVIATKAGGASVVDCDWDGIKGINGMAGPEDDGCFCCRDGKLKWMRMVSGAVCAAEPGC